MNTIVTTVVVLKLTVKQNRLYCYYSSCLKILFECDWCLGTVWTASAHIITAVIGSGVLSLAWAVAQIGWIGGPVAMLLFSFVTFYTSTLLCSCYRSGDSVTGKRNYTYMDAIHSNLGKQKKKSFRFLFGAYIGILNRRSTVEMTRPRYNKKILF